jgi:hypothetical protein
MAAKAHLLSLACATLLCCGGETTDAGNRPSERDAGSVSGGSAGVDAKVGGSGGSTASGGTGGTGASGGTSSDSGTGPADAGGDGPEPPDTCDSNVGGQFTCCGGIPCRGACGPEPGQCECRPSSMGCVAPAICCLGSNTCTAPSFCPPLAPNP